MKFKRIYVYLLVPAILFILWILLFYLPTTSKIDEKKKKLSEIVKERERVEREVETLLHLSRKGKEAENMLKELKSKIPEVSETVTFLRDIVNEARKKGVRIEGISSLFTSLKGLEGKRFVYPVFEVTVKGRFLDMGKFLEELNEKDAVRGIIKGRIYVDEKEYPDLKGQITLEIRAFKSGT